MAEEILKSEEVTEEVSEEVVNDADVEETEEYETFSVELNGITRDWAIIEEFKYKYKDVEKNYLICGEIVGDNISDAGLYIFVMQIRYLYGKLKRKTILLK